MERINKNNFEAYFLDYHEGSLSQEEKQNVLDFLQENPDLYNIFQDFDNVVLPKEDITYPDKSDLFRSDISIPEANEWEFQCIAFMEGDLDKDQVENFEKELKEDPEKEKILNLFLATRSEPDISIKFEEKAGLKKKVVLIPRWIYGAVSAAAIVVLAWIIFSPDNSPADSPGFAETKEREVIYVDKIAHPKQMERIASVESYEKNLTGSRREIITDNADDNLLNPEDNLIRESIDIASISGIENQGVVLASNFTPDAGSLFSFRYIPGAEEDEYKTLLAFTGDFVRKQLLDQDPALVEKTKFSLWELADAGLEKISNIFGTKADIEREYNSSGELMAVSFESQLLGFNTPVKRRNSAQID